ncbi:MAG: SDR family oxidoreductase [Hyphomonadaceae bacterium]|nr:SDR family oxidoreductase [Hyphomonadaceae bacterium]
MGELTGKTALVTGGARGLGAAIAEVFRREGAKLVLTDVLDDEGRALAARLGPQARYTHLDVTDEDQWRKTADFAVAEFGALDILVNNAGLLGLYPFEATSPELWNKLVTVMQTGPFLGMREVLPRMTAAGSGAVVNVASTNAVQGMANSAAYTAAKHGVLGLTRAAALEYASSGVRINAVCPGAMRTPMLEQTFGDQMDSFAEHVPLGRLSDPNEVAEVVSFLASTRASFCLGASFVVDGGMTVG